MEGACGKILDTEDPHVVIKKVHRRNRPQQRTCSLGASAQAEMQEWTRKLCLEQHFKNLYVPRAWDAERYTFKMDRIQTDKPLELSASLDTTLLRELQTLYKVAMSQGIFPMDYELYLQPDGRVAMVDFDKFSTYKTAGLIEFPWGSTMEDKIVRQHYPYLFV